MVLTAIYEEMSAMYRILLAMVTMLTLGIGVCFAEVLPMATHRKTDNRNETVRFIATSAYVKMLTDIY